MKLRSMISSSVLETDAFLALPISAQALYCHLQLFADSMGALDSVEMPRRACGASADDLETLYSAGLLLKVGTVTFITDWHVHNTVREKDQHTRYRDELARLDYSKGNPYRLKGQRKTATNMEATGQPWVNPGSALLSKELSKERMNCETAAPAGAGGGSADVCPECGGFLSGNIGSRHCFTFGCGYVEGEQAAGAGEDG